MNLLEYALTIEEFFRDQLKKTGLNGYVLGISGGVDSSLVALLLKRSGVPFKCLLLPYGNENDDLTVGEKFCITHELDYDTVDIEKAHSSLVKGIEKNDVELSKINKGNMKARLRMITLYAYSQANSYLVAGTDNLDEYYLGYFTKYGDGGVDVLPIVHLLKGEVIQLLGLLGASDEIVNRVPSAGFYPGHTDESELGFSYDVADKYFRGEPIDHDIQMRIEYLIRISQHKRDSLPSPKPPKRAIR